jgi:hypothetical protein
MLDVVNVDRILALARQVACAAPETADRRGLGELTRTVRQLRSVCDAMDARIARRASELAAEGQSEPAEAVVTDHGRRSGSEARAAVRRGEVCARHPQFDQALGDGDVTGGHLDALVRARSGLDQAAQAVFDLAAESLVEDAKVLPVDAFARRCGFTARRAAADAGVARQERLHRQRCVKRWIDPETGMHITRIALDPLTDAEMWTAIDAAIRGARVDMDRERVEPPAWGQLAADVTVGLITCAQAVDPRVPEVSVHIGFDTLRDEAMAAGVVCELEDGTPLPPATVRRLCCDANLTPVVFGGDGAVLDVGRASRLATPDQRRALAAMYSRCGFPDCHVAFGQCRIHHVTEWIPAGLTNLDNLLPLCSAHHHLVHEGGWSLTLRGDRTITLTRPDGTQWYDGPSANRCPRAGPAP